MKIESLIKRKKGTRIDMDAPTRSYLFVPASGIHSDPHVAEVDEESHIKALLRIKDGFRVADGEEEQLPVDDADDNSDLKGSSIHNASYPIKGGDTVELDVLVGMAFEDSGLDIEQWNSIPDQERYEFIDTTLKELQNGLHGEDDEQTIAENEAKQPVEPEKVAEEPAAVEEPKVEEAPKDIPVVSEEPAQVELNTLPRKDLVELFQKRFGRNPSNRLSISDLAHALSEKDED